jgi:LmbE family N-acetylglucosaminyl deacetylase
MHGSIEALGTIVGVWAHPDDEAYLSAGLMAAARRNGQRVVVVTATLGEHGTDDPVGWPPERLGRLRRQELVASLGALGVSEHHWLGRPDGGCDVVALEDGARQVAEVLRAVTPDTIVTFGPEGMTGHADHRAVSAWTTAAWQSTGRRARLLHATLTPEFHAEWGPLNERLGLWMEEPGPPSTPRAALALEVGCSGVVMEQKLAALRLQASQTAPLIAAVGEDTYRRWWATEWFVDAPPAVSPAMSGRDGRRIPAKFAPRPARGCRDERQRSRL